MYLLVLYQLCHLSFSSLYWRTLWVLNTCSILWCTTCVTSQLTDAAAISKIMHITKHCISLLIIFSCILTINYNSQIGSQCIKFSIINTNTYSSHICKILKRGAGQLPSAFPHFVWLVELRQSQGTLPHREIAVAVEGSEISSQGKHFYFEISKYSNWSVKLKTSLG